MSKPYETPLPPDEWQLWRVEEGEVEAAALYELERQRRVEHWIQSGAGGESGFWQPEDEVLIKGECMAIDDPWLCLSEERKAGWRELLGRPLVWGEAHPERWRPRKVEDWAEEFLEGRDPRDVAGDIHAHGFNYWITPPRPPVPGVPDEISEDTDWDSVSHALASWYLPRPPSADDPKGTVAKRRIPGGVKDGGEEEMLVSLVINRNASRKQLEEAFGQWLDRNGVGAGHKGKGKKASDAKARLDWITLRRLQVAAGGGAGVSYWEPLEGTPGKCWGRTKKPSTIRELCGERISRLAKLLNTV